MPARDAGQENGLKVGPGLGVGRQVGEDARVEDVEQARQLGVLDTGRELGVVDRLLGVPVVLLDHGHQDLVEQRVAEAGDLDERAPSRRSPRVPRGVGHIEHPDLLARGAGPDADDRRARRQVADRDLQGDAVDVEQLGGVDPVAGREVAEGVEVLEGSQVAQVEDGAQVDVEALGPLAGEDRPAAGEGVDRGLGQGGVIGRRQRADVARRAGQARGQDGGDVAGVGAADAVGLAAVEVGVGQGPDGAGVVEEGVAGSAPWS